ncbi:MAG: hypothetical protein EOO68_18890, partial [Moraxellaceae bacterium]
MNDAWKRVKKEISQSPAIGAILLVLCAIPMPVGVNSVALAILGAVAIFYFYRYRFFRVEAAMLYPILLFALMALSLLWSIDVHDSQKALGKEAMLLVIPLCFMMFPVLTREQKDRLLGYYSYAMTIFALFCLVRAGVRFLDTGNKMVFFYHELVTEMVNAIHVSIYFAMALLWFLNNGISSRVQQSACVVLLVCLVLLSSKNVIIIFALLATISILRKRTSAQTRIGLLVAGVAGVVVLAFSPSVTKRFMAEFSTVGADNTLSNEIGNGNVYNKSIREAWNNEKFTPNDYFPGTAMRVLQIRFFGEMLQEDAIFWNGYGLNASYGKIAEKVEKYNLYEGYTKFNFHNQYIQNFADLGFFGLLLLLVMLV